MFGYMPMYCLLSHLWRGGKVVRDPLQSLIVFIERFGRENVRI